eukprot:GHUV01038448.1.p1 GENE.GHUV01038448.1~~GHUV01038448.1.p1  ORF type:complete len:161 (-),score=40.42 GHUV01038448.1:321-803(-)
MLQMTLTFDVCHHTSKNVMLSASRSCLPSVFQLVVDDIMQCNSHVAPAEVAKYVASKSSNGTRQSWRELADKMTAQDLRLALKSAASSGDPAAGAALAAANRDGLLLALPGAAQLTDVGDAVAAAVEAAGWLRPLKFDSAAHRYGVDVHGAAPKFQCVCL